MIKSYGDVPQMCGYEPEKPETDEVAGDESITFFGLFFFFFGQPIGRLSGGYARS